MSEIASSKQTGLGGVTYEDKVNAYFMACLFSEAPPFNKDFGLIEKIKLQTRADGWLFDDALLSLNAAGSEKRIAVSVKSGQQFTTNGIPAELNNLLWQQYLKDQDAVFNADSDSLCLIEPPLSPNLSTDLNTLLNQAYQQEPGDLYSRKNVAGFTSETRRKIYDSFQCPADLTAKYNVLPQQTDVLLKHFLHHQMDFEAVNSLSEKSTIELCRRILKDKQIDKAISLYETLCRFPREQAPAGGYADREKLIQLLRGQFQLEDFPSYSGDWKKLEQYTKAKLEVILDNIGNRVSFVRDDVVREIDSRFAANKAVIVHGISGGGKSAIGKHLAERKMKDSKVIWLDSSDFEVLSLENSLGLTNSLKELITHTTTSEAYLIIDGVEKFYTPYQQQRLAALLNTILNQTDTPWKILLLCPSDNLSWMLEMLHRNNLNPSLFFQLVIENLTDEEIRQLTDTYPRLSLFLFNDKLRTLLNNLKLLDKLIFNIDTIAITKGQYLGETELIDFIWDEDVVKTENGIQKGAFIKILAEKQADSLALSVSGSEFSIAEIAPAGDLVKSNFIKYQNERFSFTHDLYGDWARYKLLLSMSEKFLSFLELKHLSSPLWTRAVRYYSIGLLEKESGDDKWKETFHLFNTKTSQHIIIQDLLLEALFFSNNALDYLEKHKDFLFENKGKHFKRLINLFQLRGTTANPSILEIAKEIELSESTAVGIDRLPIWNYWPDVMYFIHSNLEQAIELDYIGVSKLVYTWLKHTPSHFLLRREASDIAIHIARKISSGKTYIKDEIEKPIYEAMMLGFEENSEEIKKLCLTLCNRIKPEPPAIEGSGTDPKPLIKPAPVSIMDMLAIPKRGPTKWEDGPYESVDSAFQSVCLDTQALLPIIRNDPALATEILLAVLIDEPKQRYFESNYRDDYSIHEPLRWYPPFFNRGPFLNYFRINPIEALKFTLKIVDFATDRVLEENKHEGITGEGITVDYEGQKKLYKGDQSVFCWHKDIGRAPHSLVSILMAFEQFLYEEIEKKKPIEEYVRFAIKNTNSLAIAGLLLVVAKISPQLYSSELRHLLPVYEFYPWDLHTGGHDHFTLWGDLPRPWYTQAEKWKNRKHRFFPLKDAILNYWLLDKDLQKEYESITKQWEKQLTKIQDEGYSSVYLMQIIPQFRLENWELKQTDSGMEVYYKEPTAVAEYLKPGRESSLETLYDGNFAFRSDQLIKEKATITLEEAEEIWDKLQKFISILDAKDADNDSDWTGWASPYTNITAAMAALIHFKTSWIDVHPEYYSSIKEFCVTLINKEIKKNNEFDRPGTNHDWNIFLAMIAPKLWQDDEKDLNCRTLMAGVCLQFTNETVQKLFSETSKLIQWSEPSFIQLQNLILRFSAEYHKFAGNRRSGEVSFQPTKEQLVKAYREDTISRKPEDWSELRAKEKKKTKGKRYQQNFDTHDDFTRDAGLHTEVIKHIFDALPDLKSARSQAERSHILYLFKQAITQVVYELGEIKESSKEIDQYPDKFNLLVVQKVPWVIALLNDEEQPDAFWKPIFSYGYIAQRWIDIYCTHFFLANIQKPERYDKMVRLLEQMVEFAKINLAWQTKHIKRSEDFRLCVIGMQTNLITIWTDDFSTFMEKAGVIYRNWFLKNKINPFAVSALLDFVITRSGEFIIKDAFVIFKAFFGLGQLYAQSKSPAGYVFIGTPNHDRKLATVLDYIWKNKKSILKSDKSCFKIFRDLVEYLVAQKNTAAIELQNELVMEL